MKKTNILKKPRKILFVCTGNICRSPTADALLRDALAAKGMLAEFAIDSAGVDSHHIGEKPDPRTREVAKRHGTDMDYLRARNVAGEDFTEFDLILAMDRTHYERLTRTAPVGTRADIQLYLPYCGIRHLSEVPDPYYGAMKDFEFVYTLLKEATEGLVAKLL